MKYVTLAVDDNQPEVKIGSRLWQIRPSGKVGDTFRAQETCPYCEGTGKIQLKGKDFKCPACEEQKSTIYQKLVVQDLVVSSMTYTSSNTSKTSIKSTDSCWVQAVKGLTTKGYNQSHMQEVDLLMVIDKFDSESMTASSKSSIAELSFNAMKKALSVAMTGNANAYGDAVNRAKQLWFRKRKDAVAIADQLMAAQNEVYKRYTKAVLNAPGWLRR